LIGREPKVDKIYEVNLDAEAQLRGLGASFRRGQQSRPREEASVRAAEHVIQRDCSTFIRE